MKVLNAYGGIGGNRKDWGIEHEITMIESNQQIADAYQLNFPNDRVIIADAHQYILDHYDEFDFIWSSPPCQSHSKMVKFTRHDIRKYPDFSLYQEIVFLDNFFKGKYVVENVNPYYKPIITPSVTFGRHLIWSNFQILPIKTKNIDDFINISGVAGAEELKKWLGIYYDGTIYYDGNHDPTQVLRNAVHPDLGLHILNESQRNGRFNA